MRIRKFRARDMKGVLSLVRETLGPKALILEARRSSSSSDGPQHVAALAACDPSPDLSPKTPRRRDQQLTSIRPGQARASVPDGDLEAASDRISFLSGLVASDHFSHLTPWAREIYLDLLQCEVDPDLAFGILEALVQSHDGGELTAEALGQHIRPLLRTGGCLVAGGGGPRVVLFVGAPGAGKTTTCAKLAAHLRHRGQTVVLLSLEPDSFRVRPSLESIGAVLGLPAASADSNKAVRDLLGGAFASLSSVLVDTPGIVWKDDRWGKRLGSLFSGVPGVSVHILVPAAMRARDQLRSVTAMLHLKPAAITFTRMDETDRYGCLLSLPLRTSLPVAYLCDGPRIPEDIQEARVDNLLKLITSGLNGSAVGDGRRSERSAA
jgi:flagellar biosynthesis protein FlhF